MPAKTYQVTQTVNLNGSKTSVSFQVHMEESELQSFLPLLEGGYTVKVVDSALSNTAGSDVLVSQVNKVSRITMSGNNGVGKETAYISGFNGQIMFKQSASFDDIRTVLYNAHPFKLIPTEKPIDVFVGGSERSVVAPAP